MELWFVAGSAVVIDINVLLIGYWWGNSYREGCRDDVVLNRELYYDLALLLYCYYYIVAHCHDPESMDPWINID